MAHIVSTTEPRGGALGDEWHNPATNILYKYLAIDGTTPSWIANPGVVKINSITYPTSDLFVFTDGGQLITINGSGFNPGIQVFVGSTRCAATYISSTQITFTTPVTANTAATYVVYLYNTDGSSGVLPIGITYRVKTQISFLLVAGGGGGGQGGPNGVGGGGGGGGVVLGNVLVTAGTPISWVVGGGGLGQPGGGPGPLRGFTASNTTLSAPGITTVIALGGGGGGCGGGFPSPAVGQGLDGGSGGGGTGGNAAGPGLQPTFNPANPAVSSQYGNAGGSNPGSYPAGSPGGGAGGAGTVGAVGTNAPGGLDLNVASYTVNVAGGGATAPGTAPQNTSGSNGSPGGYGGQSASGNPVPGTSGNGGGGTVILMVPTASYPGSAPGAVVSTPSSAPGKTILTYTNSGSFTA
jgi:hypothetical protein